MYNLTRGSTKTTMAYMTELKKLYDENKIVKEDYIFMVGAARVLLFNESEEEALKWIEQQLNEGE